MPISKHRFQFWKTCDRAPHHHFFSAALPLRFVIVLMLSSSGISTSGRSSVLGFIPTRTLTTKPIPWEVSLFMATDFMRCCTKLTLFLTSSIDQPMYSVRGLKHTASTPYSCATKKCFPRFCSSSSFGQAYNKLATYFCTGKRRPPGFWGRGALGCGGVISRPPQQCNQEVRSIDNEKDHLPLLV